MATLLTEKDFRGEILIANTERPVECEELTRFIGQYEPKFMREALGNAFAAVVYAQAGASSRDAIWDVLITGGDWQSDYTGKLLAYHTEGLKYCLARYVYFYYRRNDITLTTQSGEVQTSTDNSTSASAVQKQGDAWNQMSREIRIIWNMVTYAKVNNALAFDTSGMDNPLYWKFKSVSTFAF